MKRRKTTFLAEIYRNARPQTPSTYRRHGEQLQHLMLSNLFLLLHPKKHWFLIRNHSGRILNAHRLERVSQALDVLIRQLFLGFVAVLVDGQDVCVQQRQVRVVYMQLNGRIK